MNVVVGCPVNGRDWILPSWFEHLAAACEAVHWRPSIVMVMPSQDRADHAILHDYCKRYGWDAYAVKRFSEDVRPHEARRDWGSSGRLEHMAKLRNLLLVVVRSIGPDLFLSLDSDMLLAPDALTCAEFALRDGYDGVGLRTYMTATGRDYPSCGILNQNRLWLRPDASEGTFAVDVLMGAILMLPHLFLVQYAYHAEGEDVAWSIAARSVGMRFGWCASARAKHVMSPPALGQFDPRVGF